MAAIISNTTSAEQLETNERTHAGRKILFSPDRLSCDAGSTELNFPKNYLKFSAPAEFNSLEIISVEICILAGGKSSRMGRDKSRLRLGGKTLLGRVCQTAKALPLPVRTIRRDLVPRCGPLGGIYTALKTTSNQAVLFLACDMPLVSVALLERLLLQSKSGRDSTFTWNDETAGFPFILNRNSLPTVQKLLAKQKWSIQVLASETLARRFNAGRAFKTDLLNVNTPTDWVELQEIFSENH